MLRRKFGNPNFETDTELSSVQLAGTRCLYWNEAYRQNMRKPEGQ